MELHPHSDTIIAVANNNFLFIFSQLFFEGVTVSSDFTTAGTT